MAPGLSGRANPSGGIVTPPSILLVEDDAFIALDMVDQLEKAGYRVLGPAATAADGLALLASAAPQAAVLDVRLADETSEPVAMELSRRQIPFVVASGYSPEQHPPAYRGRTHFPKPVNVTALLRELSRLCG